MCLVKDVGQGLRLGPLFLSGAKLNADWKLVEDNFGGLVENSALVVVERKKDDVGHCASLPLFRDSSRKSLIAMVWIKIGDDLQADGLIMRGCCLFSGGARMWAKG